MPERIYYPSNVHEILDAQKEVLKGEEVRKDKYSLAATYGVGTVTAVAISATHHLSGDYEAAQRAVEYLKLMGASALISGGAAFIHNRLTKEKQLSREQRLQKLLDETSSL